MFEDSIVIYTGPSLHPDRARVLLNVTVLPPIKRGDLARLKSRPQIIGIIDGEFYQSLAVSPKEILPLIEAGVIVYGASSMGALRAVELRNCGMIGVGRVFRLFRSGLLEAEDEVALAYSPASFQPVSEPLVNTRFILRTAVRQGILKRSHAAAILARIRAIYFPERTNQLMLSLCREIAGLDVANRMKLFLVNGAPNIKQQDAIELIRRIERQLVVRPDSASSSPSRAPLRSFSGAA